MFAVVIEFPTTSTDTRSRVGLIGPFDEWRDAEGYLQQSGFEEEPWVGECLPPDWTKARTNQRAWIEPLTMPRTEEEERRTFQHLLETGQVQIM